MNKIMTGAEADAFMDAIESENLQKRKLLFEKYKAEAAANGKEPFDLDKLGEYIDLTWRVECSDYPQVVTREEKIEHYEERYYVSYPDVMTLKDFAVKVEELRLWDLE
jgi:hypothetical protein